MSHVTLIRPPTVFARRSYSVPTTPPIGIAYLAASLRKAGHVAHVIDAVGEGISNVGSTSRPYLKYHGLPLEAILARIAPATQLIAISAMFSHEWPHTRELVAAIGQRFPHIPLVVGGEHATAAWTYILESCREVVCVGMGEGEETICDLAEWAKGGKRLEIIPGIAYCNEGRCVTTEPRMRIEQIDEIPWPAWDLLPIDAYLKGGFGHGVDAGPSMPILATRGCPYRCAFCSNPSMWTTRYYMRSIISVVDEIELYLHRYGATNIDFYDLTAIIRKEWILQFCDEIVRRGLHFSWQMPSGTRTEALDQEVLTKLYEVGCRNMTYAPESGSERTLREISKKVHLGQMISSIVAAKRAGISIKCNLIIGFPKERRSDVLRTIWFAVKMAWHGVDDVPLFMFSPYPGSALYDYLRSTNAIPTMNDDYFESLVCYMDLSRSSRYCERIGPKELNLYRFIGMSVFYLLSYLLYPARILRTIHNIRNRTAITVFEQRVIDLLHRWVLANRTKEPGCDSINNQSQHQHSG